MPNRTDPYRGRTEAKFNRNLDHAEPNVGEPDSEPEPYTCLPIPLKPKPANLGELDGGKVVGTRDRIDDALVFLEGRRAIGVELVPAATADRTKLERLRNAETTVIHVDQEIDEIVDQSSKQMIRIHGF